MAVSMRHCQLMAEVGAFADAAWEDHGPFIVGELGFQAVHRVGVGMSHPPLPIFAYYLGLIPMASNGATVTLWDSPDPLCRGLRLPDPHRPRNTSGCGTGPWRVALT